jgi:predicted nucleotidyltransferase
MSTKVKKRLQEQAAWETLSSLTAALYEQLGSRLVALVLFGSRARGDAGDNSDWDLLLIAEDLPRKVFERHMYVKRLLPLPWRAVASVLAKTPNEFEASLQTVYLDIATDGIILYDKGQYVSDRLAKVRRQLQSAGLHRTQQGREMQWRWKSMPRADWSFEWDDVLV